LLLCPTTAGYDLLSVGYALHQQAEKVLEDVFAADHLFAVIYTLDPEDDWRDPEMWVKALPLLGVTPKREYVEKYALDAQQVPGVEGEFRVKMCNHWAQSAAQWLSMTAWDRCADERLNIEDFLGAKCWIGNDLASVDDLTATVLVFERGDELVAFLRCYLPAGVVELRARYVPEYRIWSDDGVLLMTDGTMTDYARVEADLRLDCKRFKVQEIVFDQYGSQQICGNLANSGLPAVIEAKTAKATTPAARDLEARVVHGKFRHDGSSLFKWFASNTQVTRRTDDSLLPKKDAAESPRKIDGVDALISAMGSRLRGKQVREKEYQMLILGGQRRA
jgi:phage terminase large subunit-like protein